MYYFHPSAIRERRELVSPKALAIDDSFQTLNSVEEISATPPGANTLPLGTLPLEDVQRRAPISDEFESKRRADAKTVQANFRDDIRTAPPQENPHLFETESPLLDATPNEQVSRKPPVQMPSILRDIIEICKLLGIQGLAFGIFEHGIAVAIVLAQAYSVTKLAPPDGTAYPLLLHPLTWVLLGLARGASVIGCFALCVVLILLFVFLLWIALIILPMAFGPAVSSEKNSFAIVMLIGAVVLYVEYLGLNCGEGSQSENASFFQSKVCK